MLLLSDAGNKISASILAGVEIYTKMLAYFIIP